MLDRPGAAKPSALRVLFQELQVLDIQSQLVLSAGRKGCEESAWSCCPEGLSFPLGVPAIPSTLSRVQHELNVSDIAHRAVPTSDRAGYLSQLLLFCGCALLHQMSEA